MNFARAVFFMAVFLTTPLLSENKKIVVVGAGLAGLTTAYRLHQKKCDVHVYEARHRVGGRIFTVKTAGHFAELGGQNIADGGKASNIRHLLKEFHLELVESKSSLGLSYYSGEKQVSLKQLFQKLHFQPEQLKKELHRLAQKSRNMRDVLNGILDRENPLYKTLKLRLEAYEGGSIDNLSPLYVDTLYYMLLDGISSAFEPESDGPFVNRLSVREGNSKLPEALGEALGNRLHLNKVLLSVSKDAQGSYHLTFQDGEHVKADILVLAIPCSVYTEIQFADNVIPEEKLSAIKKIQYGENAKIVIPCNKSLPIKGFVNDHMISFFTPNQNYLTLYYIGRSSSFPKESYSLDLPLIEQAFKDLEPFLSTPTPAQDQFLGPYHGPVYHNWTNDPYAKGSYSYIAAGQETVLTATLTELRETVKNLFAPIHQKLFFAGEHASILTDVPGTMESACESGERTARMILNSSHQF